MAAPPALPFHPAVVIEHGPRVGSLRVVASVGEAAECLLRGWPEAGRGKAYRAAAHACHAALEGTLEATTARKAFVLAAVEAGIFVREGDGRP